MKKLVTILMILISLSATAQKEVPFTLEDRGRLIKVESGLESLRYEINTKFEAVDDKFESQQQQIDDLKAIFKWGFSIPITIMLFILGFIIWDRYTALAPLRKQQEKEKIEVEKFKNALKQIGESDQKIAEILKRASLY